MAFLFTRIFNSTQRSSGVEGRKYENNIRLDYLKHLNERYEAWVETYNLGKMLIIDVDHINFRDKPEDLSTVIDRVNAEIHGLF